jgi:hypothetical protein
MGPCCICGADDAPIAFVVMLDVKGQVPGHGWGCLVCGLPHDGANAVVCADCAAGYEKGELALRFACRGYPGEDGRVPIGEVTIPHEHDETVDHG